jgi:hypothetical protein
MWKYLLLSVFYSICISIRDKDAVSVRTRFETKDKVGFTATGGQRARGWHVVQRKVTVKS